MEHRLGVRGLDLSYQRSDADLRRICDQPRARGQLAGARHLADYSPVLRDGAQHRIGADLERRHRDRVGTDRGAVRSDRADEDSRPDAGLARPDRVHDHGDEPRGRDGARRDPDRCAAGDHRDIVDNRLCVGWVDMSDPAGTLACGGPTTTLSFGHSLKVHVTSPTTKATCGTVDNTASVVTSNDGTARASASVEVLCAEIALTKTADHTPVLIGEQIGYTIAATNNGAGTARDVTMTDPLPSTPGTSWRIASASPGWKCAIASGNLTCGGTGTSLAPGDSLSVHVTSASTGNICGTVDNTATVATSNDGTATASATITVLCPMDPSITTKVSKTVIRAGGSLTDTATLTGPSGPVTGAVDFRLCPGTTTGCPQGRGTTFDQGVPLNSTGAATSRLFGFRLPPGHYSSGSSTTTTVTRPMPISTPEPRAGSAHRVEADPA